MNKIKTLFGCFVVLATMLACSDDKDDNNTPQNPQAEVTVINVDVVMPKSIQDTWQQTIDWALDNIAKAQRLEDKQVKL
ncbi:MAG: hypothetical protein IKG77_05360, partial [Prevotella sp.]|nr:hypothetical protein [Prevotella sp.]